MTTLFERLGGAPAIDAAVELFYRKVLGDPLLAPFFDSVDMDGQLAKQKAFLTMVSGGPNAYTGRDLREAHSGLVARGIGDAHVDAVIKHLGATLRELGVDEAAISEVAGVAESVRDEVLSR